MAKKKRRTAAQIRATKKLVALNKKRARKNAGHGSQRKSKKQFKKSFTRNLRTKTGRMKTPHGKPWSRTNKARRPKRKLPKGWITGKAFRIVRRGGKRILEVRR
jgi:hypothetical protein